MTGCQSPDESAAPKTGSPGVTAQEVVLGSSLALKGHASFLGTQTFRGAMCYLNHVNELGGVHGRSIKVVAYDDSYDPPMCLANTQQLIIDDQVFALFCYVGTPTTVQGFAAGRGSPDSASGHVHRRQRSARAVQSLADQRAGLLLPGDQGGRPASGDDLGLKKIAIFYQYDAYGFDGLTGTELALKGFDLAPVAGGSYNRGTLDVQEGLDKVISSGGRGRGDDRDLRPLRGIHPTVRRTGIPSGCSTWCLSSG